MWKAKRRGDHLTRSFHKSKRASKNESMLSGRFLKDSDQVVLSGLSDRPISYLSKIVASITLYKGNIMVLSCSGIAIERQGCHLTRFLTSASLVRALNSNEDRDDWKIEVCPEGNEVYMGVMSAFDIDRNFVVVSVHGFVDVQVGSFQYALQIPPHGEILVAIGRAVSGEIIVKNVEFEGDPIVLKDDEEIDCRISEAWEGGPLASVDGKVVGINLFLTTRRAVFVPCGTILKHLKHYLTSQQKKAGLAQSKTTNVYRFGARPIGEESNSYSEVHENFLNQKQLYLEAMGYPKLPSSMSGAGMILANTFEETFGDIHGEGVWRKFSKKASNINRNVVALASFNGGKRFFACTGFFIEWNESTIILTSASLVRSSGDENKIADNLRIQVLLNSQCREGMLQHYNLHYNVALVSVKDYPTLRPSKTLLWWNRTFEVAAIGRCFKTGALMATTGDLVCWTGTLDCDFLATSTCKITKAGIGGPLVSLDGDVIGMNFYDKRIGTPFLGLSDIYRILALFETKSKPGEHLWKMDEDEKTKPNRWPVPMPRWCNEDEDKSDDDDEGTSDDDELGFDPKYGPVRYSYDKGMKVRLC